MSAPEALPEELRVASAAEIAAYLQQLQQDGASVRLQGPHGAGLSATIVALDAAADVLGLALGAVGALSLIHI